MSSEMATAIDPICGMTVNRATAIQAVKDGETYFFCCPKCKERFLSDQAIDAPKLVSLSLSAKSPSSRDLPQIAGVAQAQPTCCAHAKDTAIEPSALSAYFCPMCPGEESDRPGYCRKCGMALERNPNFHDAAADAALARSEVRFRIKVLWALALAAIVFLLAMLPMLGFKLDHWISAMASGWLQCFLTTAILLLAWPYWLNGFGAIKHRTANMFTLIGLGAWSAFALSLLYLVVPQWFPHATAHTVHQPLYFESAAVIVALVMLGQWLEGSARKSTGSDLEHLIGMLPKTAHRLKDNMVEDIEPLDLQVGDQVLIKPGETIPADSILLEGTSEVDESLLTGESLPVTKEIGDSLIAGSTNHLAVLKARVVKVGRQSVLAEIIARVGNAQRSRAPIQDTVDRITVYFVPLVVAVALLAALGWWCLGPEPRGMYAFLAALSVLVIACPCALGLATPMSIMVGVGRAAREGFLISDAKAFQKMATVDTILFDKTGTLTEGKPRVVSWDCLLENQETYVLQVAVAIEQTSEHPLAVAIAKFARRQFGAGSPSPLIVTGIQTIPGSGTTGWIEGKRIAIGKKSWLESLLVKDAAQFSMPERSELAPAMESEAWLAIDEQIAARFRLADEPRETAVDSLQQLRVLGMELYLLSGDRAEVVQSVAQRVGLSHYRGEVSPEQKRHEIETLKRSGRRVAMVGDGINDAPALATADVGIAMSTGTNLAQQSSDVVLLEGDLRRIAAAIRLSRQVILNIKQNLVLGLMYNVVAIPIAAGLLYPWTGWTLSPMLAAAAMAASSLSVVGNALRLRLQR